MRHGVLQVKAEFMQMLREVVSTDRPMTWDNIHSMVEFDPRCRAIASNTQKEDWFREFCASVHPVKTLVVQVIDYSCSSLEFDCQKILTLKI